MAVSIDFLPRDAISATTGAPNKWGRLKLVTVGQYLTHIVTMEGKYRNLYAL